jgi:FMN phosphatase YigB (HAD superfamily)
MITTIVFDLGNVLLSFKPEEFLTHNGYDEALKNQIINDIFKSKEWLLLDNGDISIEEAIIRISERSMLSQQYIATVFNLRTQIMFPLAANLRVLPELKERGFKLYYLSNFPDDIFDEVYNRYSFFSYFDGGIISARVNTSKPDEKIFRILLEKYSINISECLFVDDSEINVRAAESIGIKVVHLNNHDNLMHLIESALVVHTGN